MFTGLTEKVGRLVRIDRTETGALITVGHEPWDEPLRIGESVSVHGICLTVASCGGGLFKSEALRETMERTNLAGKRAGSLLNLERSVRADGRMGGHIVSGHVDGVGRVERILGAGMEHSVRISCGADLAGGIVMKGSIACDGVSLTVAAMHGGLVDVEVTRFTWENTALREWAPGAEVNIETDVIGKYVRKCVEESAGRKSVDMETLRNAGFA